VPLTFNRVQQNVHARIEAQLARRAGACAGGQGPANYGCRPISARGSTTAPASARASARSSPRTTNPARRNCLRSWSAFTSTICCASGGRRGDQGHRPDADPPDVALAGGGVVAQCHGPSGRPRVSGASVRRWFVLSAWWSRTAGRQSSATHYLQDCRAPPRAVPGAVTAWADQDPDLCPDLARALGTPEGRWEP
jgi:hypothetical protein